MHNVATVNNFDWRCKKSWISSAINTFWCLLGCTTGNFLTILFFQFFLSGTPGWLVFLIAPIVGLATSISLESLILVRQHMDLNKAIKTAFGMSFISMIMMQVVANSMNVLIAGDVKLTEWSILPSLVVGFISVWPYNYYRLKKYAKACH